MSERLPDTVEMLARLVAVPSVSSHDPRLDTGNRPVIDLLAGWLDAVGFACETMPIPGRPTKFNLIARRGEGVDGFVLAGHTDTVPYDEAGWSSDPFTLTAREGRLYGLGSADMKGFFPAALRALEASDLDRLGRALTLVATADEESSMSGAKALAESGRALGRYALIGEPTGLRPIRMHKGVMMAVVRVHGRSGHASDPALGNSALEGMHRVIAALLAWRERLQARNRDPMFKVAVPTVNLGHIHGGDSPNRICAECELHLDLRLLPDMRIDAIASDLKMQVEGALAGSGLGFEVEPMFEGLPPMRTDPQSEVVRLAEELSGQRAGAVAFGTEGPHFARMGMETVVLGAGDIERAHQPDEYVPLAQLEALTGILTGMIRHFCGR